MRILITRDNFSTERYDIKLREEVIEFIGESESSVLPYSEVKDFTIIEDRRGRTYFNLPGFGVISEGRILSAEEIKPFAAALREKLDGIINIEIRR